MTGRCLLVVLLLALSGCGPPRPEDLPPFPVDMDIARDPDGRLRFWKDPQPLFTYPPSNEFLHGKALFSNNCAACHTLYFGDPDLLQGTTERHSRQWLYAFTRDNQKLRNSGDPYAIALYNQFNKTAMPAFPQLSDADIDDIYRYIDEDAFRRHPPPIPTINS